MSSTGGNESRRDSRTDPPGRAAVLITPAAARPGPSNPHHLWAYSEPAKGSCPENVFEAWQRVNRLLARGSPYGRPLTGLANLR